MRLLYNRHFRQVLNIFRSLLLRTYQKQFNITPIPGPLGGYFDVLLYNEHKNWNGAFGFNLFITIGLDPEDNRLTLQKARFYMWQRVILQVLVTRNFNVLTYKYIDLVRKQLFNSCNEADFRVKKFGWILQGRIPQVWDPFQRISFSPGRPYRCRQESGSPFIPHDLLKSLMALVWLSSRSLCLNCSKTPI